MTVLVGRILPLIVALTLVCCGAAEQNLQARPPTFPAHPVLAKFTTNAADWQKQRVEIKKAWQQFLGELPRIKAPLRPQIKTTDHLDGFSRSLVRYAIEPGIFTDGYLLQPQSLIGRAPAVVVFHPTTPIQAKGVAGVDARYDEEKQQGIHLVRRGFIVWCPRNYINDDGADWTGNAKRVIAAHPDWTGMTRMTWDAIRAADYVQSLPNVDGDRIGCLGHSLGAKVVLFAMAFDERYKAGVFSEGGIGLNFSNWEAPWYLGPRLRDAGFLLDNYELLALIAPRSFLLLAGDSADGDRSWPYIEAARPVFKALDATQNIGWFNHHQGHRYPPEARAVAEEFLLKHLGR
jgi:hypothetical protein